MVKSFAVFIISVVLAATTQASNFKTLGVNMHVEFPHKRHQTALGGCTDCHGTSVPGPIAQFGVKWVHGTCKECHVESKAGPTECQECHAQI